MRVLVCGGRNFGALPRSKPPHEVEPGVYSYVDRNHSDYPVKKAEYDFIIRTLEEYASQWCPGYPSEDIMLPYGITIISGKAKGVDTVAIDWAVVNWLQFEEYPADWKKYGRQAGYIRNKRMLDEGKPDLVVAFPGGKGTQMMIEIARKAGVEVIEVKYES